MRRLPVTKRDRLLGLLYELSTGLAEVSGVEDLGRRTFDLLGEHLGWQVGALFARRSHESHLELLHAVGLPDGFAREAATLSIDPTTPCGAAVFAEEVRFLPVGETPYEDFCGAELAGASSVSLPLEGRGRNVGLLVVFTPGVAEQELPGWVRSGLPALSQVLGLALANALLLQDVERAAESVRRSESRAEELAGLVEGRLREPLLRCEALAHTLEEDFGSVLPDEARELLQALRASVGQVGPDVASLIELARVRSEPGLRVPVDMEELVLRVGTSLRMDSPALDLRHEGALPRAVTDLHRIEGALRLLVSRVLPVDAGAASAVFSSPAPDSDASVSRLAPRRNTYRLRTLAPALLSPDEPALLIARRVFEAEGGTLWLSTSTEAGVDLYFTLPAAAP